MKQLLLISFLVLLLKGWAQCKYLVIRSQESVQDAHIRTKRDLENSNDLVMNLYGEQSDEQLSESLAKPKQNLAYFVNNPDAENRGKVTLKHTIPEGYIITDFSFHNNNDAAEKNKITKSYFATKETASEEMDEAINKGESAVVVSTNVDIEGGRSMDEVQLITAVIEIAAGSSQALNITFQSALSFEEDTYKSDIEMIVDQTNPSIEFLILSPNYEIGKYPNNAYMTWTVSYLRATDYDTNYNVETTVVSIDTQECCDRLFIYDGDSTSGSILDVWSGTDKVGSTSKSSGDTLMVQFASDCFYGNGGFALSFNSTISTSSPGTNDDPDQPDSTTKGPIRSEITLTASVGNIYNPSYPVGYHGQSTFIWWVSIDTTEALNSQYPVKLTLVDLDIGLYDELTIQDLSTGEYVTFEDSGVFHSFVLLSSNFQVNFTADRKGPDDLINRGFYITYSENNDINQNYLFNSSLDWQYISTSNFPDQYNNNENIQWVINGPSKLLIEVQSLNLEPTYDYLIIYEGETTQYPLSILTGNEQNKPLFVTTGTSALITFNSDDSVTDQGFQIRYKHIPYNDTQCNGLEEIEIGTDKMSFVSANFPSYSYNRNTCSWNFTAAYDQCIQADLLAYEYYYSYNFVEMYDGPDNTSKVLYKNHYLHKYDMPDPPEIITSQNHLLVNMTGHDYFWFDVYEVNCTEIPMYQYNLTNLQGSLHSPFYPSFYPKEINALWYVTVPSGYYIYFDLIFANIEYVDCNSRHFA